MCSAARCSPGSTLNSAKACLDGALWRQLGVESGWAHHVYVVFVEEGDFTQYVAPEGFDGIVQGRPAVPMEDQPMIHVRMFAPGSGVLEDPATGSAAAALGSYIGARLEGDGEFEWIVRQGIE